jgi:predicted Zn-dependent peptidase
MPGPISAIALHVSAGARFDGRHPGIAHMAEHMLFQGTPFRNQLDLNRRAAELGGNHNANTGYDTVALSIEVFNEDVDAALELLFDQFYSSSVDEARFRKEKRVVMDEVRGIQDDPFDRLHERVWCRFFSEPIGHPICGSLSSLREIDAADVRRYLRQLLVNSNAALSVVGGIEEESLRASLRRCVRAERAGQPALPKRVRRRESGRLDLRGKNGGQCFTVRMIEVDSTPKNLLAVGVALDLVGADPDSALFQAVREDHGLGYDVGADLEWGVGFAAAIFSASAQAGRGHRLERVIDEVIQRASLEGFSHADLVRGRKKRRYRYALLAERRLDRAFAHADSELSGFPNLEETQRLVDGLRDDEILAAWRRVASARSLTATLDG